MASKSNETNHILLTGLPGVGKTTLICKLCSILNQKNIPTIGFYTKEIRNNTNLRIGFDVITLDGKTGRLARSFDTLDSNEITNYKVGNYSVFIKEFEALALPVLQQKITDGVLIIDEIGKMELFSPKFVKIIAELFKNSKIKIIATIPISRGKTLPLIEKLRNDSKNFIITVDRSNRNNLTTEILNNLQIY